MSRLMICPEAKTCIDNDCIYHCMTPHEFESDEECGCNTGGNGNDCPKCVPYIKSDPEDLFKMEDE